MLSHSVMSDSLWPPWNVAHQAPLSMEILQARILEWVAMPSSRGSSQPSDRTCISHTVGEFFTVWAAREAHISLFISGHFICSEGYLSYRIYPLPLSFNFFVMYLFPCFQTTYIIIIKVNSLWTDYILLCQFLTFNYCVKPSVFNDMLELKSFT